MATRASLSRNFPIPLERAEFARRLELAREVVPETVARPRLKFLLREIGAMLWPLRKFYSRYVRAYALPKAAHPRTVMVLPGFGTGPSKMRYFAQLLEGAGHTVKRWGIGFNWGPTEANFAALEQRLLDLHDRTGERVYLVGWSLGGLFAREIAKRQPQAVAKVITMGTPFSYSPRANHAWRIYQFVAGHRVEQPPVGGVMAEKPPVETIALWSANDGVIHPKSACGRAGERDRAIALRCGHMGFAHSHESIEAVARELDRD